MNAGTEARDLIAAMNAGTQYARAVELAFDEAHRLSRTGRTQDARDAIEVAWRAVRLRQDARKEINAMPYFEAVE